MNKREKKVLKKKKRRRRGRIVRRVILIIILVILILIAGACAYLWHKYGSTVESCKKEADTIAAESTADDFLMQEGTSIYDADNNLIIELGTDTKERQDLTYDQIPDNVKNAFIAVEDRTFWDNKGYDLRGVARVIVTYIRTGGEVRQGASTITQQLARNIYLSNEKTMTRKITEIFLAADLTQKYSKEDILTAYINNVYFANNFYGIEAAAEGYFGKSASDLSLSEVAYLAAIPNRPAYYDPWVSPNNALSRRDKILEDMCTCGFITEQERDDALNEQIVIHAKPTQTADESYSAQKEAFSTFAIHCAARYLMQYEGFEFRYAFDTDEEYETYQTEYNDAFEEARAELYQRNYTVYTSLDPDTQDKVQDVVDTDLSESVTSDSGNTDTGDDGIYELQSAVTVIDNETGKVTAIVGGRSQKEASGGMNRAYQAYRQPGSSIKPLIVYTPALEGEYDADSKLQSIDVEEANKQGADVDAMTGKEMTLRYAVEVSDNGAAYYLYNIIKPAKGLSYLEKMEFDRIVPSDFNLASGLGGLTYGVNTVQMAGAYAAIDYDGVYRETTCITDILDPDGNSIFRDADEVSVYTAEASEEMKDILEGVISNTSNTQRSGASAQLENRDFTVAGKTGTTNDNKDAWFCGFAPATGYKIGQGYTVAVWCGYDTPREDENRLWGHALPATVWKDVMEALISENTRFDKSSAQIKKEKEEQDAADAAAAAAAAQAAQDSADQSAAESARASIASISGATTVQEATDFYNTALSQANSISDDTLKQTVISEATAALNAKTSELNSGTTPTNPENPSQEPQQEPSQGENTQPGENTEENTNSGEGQ